MKKFIYQLSIFLIPIILLLYPLDIYISNSLKKSHDAQGELEVWEDIYSGKMNVDFAIYGSSRAWVHFDPSLISKLLNLNTYNFGVDGYNFDMVYFRHCEFIKHNKKPKTIVLSIDCFSLEKRKDLYNIEQFFPYMLGNTKLKAQLAKYNGTNWYDYYIPLIRFTGSKTAIKSIVKDNEKLPPHRQLGFKAIEQSWSNDLEKATAAMDNYVVKIDNSSLSLFYQFISECKKDEIELVFVYAPEFIEGQNFIKNRAEILTLYNTIAAENNIKFINYSSDEICKNKKYFYNSVHLNSKGAKLFTENFIVDYKNIR